MLIDGEPLTYGFVQVIPKSARAASGEIGKDGRFSLKTFEDNDGVVPGKHAVRITAAEYLNETEILWHAPPKYGQPEMSGLSVDIQQPTDSLVIKLTWDGDKPYYTRDGQRVKK